MQDTQADHIEGQNALGRRLGSLLRYLDEERLDAGGLKEQCLKLRCGITGITRTDSCTCSASLGT